MFNKLEEIIKVSEGNVLAVCLDNNLIIQLHIIKKTSGKSQRFLELL